MSFGLTEILHFADRKMRVWVVRMPMVMGGREKSLGDLRPRRAVKRHGGGVYIQLVCEVSFDVGRVGTDGRARVTLKRIQRTTMRKFRRTRQRDRRENRGRRRRRIVSSARTSRGTAREVADGEGCRTKERGTGCLRREKKRRGR